MSFLRRLTDEMTRRSASLDAFLATLARIELADRVVLQNRPVLCFLIEPSKLPWSSLVTSIFQKGELQSYRPSMVWRWIRARSIMCSPAPSLTQATIGSAP